MGAPHEVDFDDEEGGGLNLGRYLAAVLRNKWMILGLTAVGLAAGFGASKLVKPVYEARAQISINVVDRTQTSPVRNTPLLESRAWLGLLNSFFVLDEVVRRRHLYVATAQPADAALFENLSLADDFTTGDFRLTTDASGSSVRLSSVEGGVLEQAAAGDSLGASLGFLWVAPSLRPGQAVDFSISTPRDASVKLAREIVPSLPPVDASFMTLQLRGVDPEATAATLNTLAERFVEVATLLKREKLTYTAGMLREQLASAHIDLRTAEAELETYRVSTITLPSERGATQIASGLTETRDPVRNAFFDLRINRDALVRDRDAISRALSSAADSGELLLVTMRAIPSVTESTELSASLTELGEKRAEASALSVGFSQAHLPLQKLQREIEQLERRTIPTQAASLVASLNQRIGDYDQRIAASSREMQQIPTRAIEQARRERDLDIAQRIYSELRVAYEQAALAERSAAPDVRILDRAVPPTTPVTDQILIIIAAGALGGFGLGILLAILLDRFDRRLRYPDQVTKDLGLQILGALPLVREGKNKRLIAEDDVQLTEALRSVRMSLTYAHGTAGAFITTVTSPGPGDGKSFVSMNLAKSFASAGHRTLLIDGDTRRGHLHRTLGMNRRPGLLDFLRSTAPREAIIRSVAEGNYDFIACGTRSADGPEMLASSQMAQLLMSLRSEYSAIIVDSPPLGAGVDPMVLAALCGSLVMVLRTGVTDKDLAESRLQDVHRLPIRVLGAVLNDVQPQGVYRYYSYLPGYRAEDEIDQETEPPTKRRLLGVARR